MKYPSWKDFESKYPDYQEIAFEALARMLFRCRYELGDSLPYFKNQAGNETETIVVDGEEIGFQAKYFDNEINASLIEHSIKTAHTLCSFIALITASVSFASACTKPLGSG